jgi:hypothetical protein
MWNLILVHLEMLLVSMQDRCMFAANVPQPQKSFWTHLMVLLGDTTQLEDHFSLFGDSVNLDAR